MPSFETFHNDATGSWSRRNFLRAAGVAPVALSAAQLARTEVTPADAAVASAQAASGSAASGLAVSGLTTDYMVTPLGVDLAAPRLGWTARTSEPGTIDDWFFKYLAGIQPAAPGYQRITVQPYVPSGLSEVDAYQTTPYGKVAVRWHTSGGTFRLSVTIPPNTTASVSVPAAPAAQVSALSGAVPLQRAGGYASYRSASATTHSPHETA